MTWKPALIAVLGLALGWPAFADPEELPDAPKQDDKEEMPGSDEQANEDEQVNPLEILERVIGNQKDAESKMADLGSLKATKDGGEEILVEELAKSAALQQRAIDQMSRLFDGGENAQDAAIRDLELLIKSAKGGD